jgi:hypothetical protein
MNNDQVTPRQGNDPNIKGSKRGDCARETRTEVFSTEMVSGASHQPVAEFEESQVPAVLVSFGQ